MQDVRGDLIQWLRGFYFTVISGSLTAATQVMNRNQSAITYQIQSLENLFGVPLFTRGKGKRALTEEGKYLFVAAKELFNEISKIRDEIGNGLQREAVEIRIAAPNSVIQYYLPKPIADFRLQYPETSFILDGSSSPQQVLDMVQFRKVDFGLACLSTVPNNFERRPLFVSQVVLISPKSGPYSVSTPDLHSLADFPYIAPPLNSNFTQHLRYNFAYFGITMRNQIVSSYADGAKAFVAQGLGIAFLSDFSITEDDRKDLNIIPINAFHPQEYGLVYRKGSASSNVCSDFMKWLEARSSLGQIEKNTPPVAHCPLTYPTRAILAKHERTQANEGEQA